MQPKKHFGQNFLTSIPARNKMIEAGGVTAHDTVLEIGPGKGFLTRALLDTGARVIALEKDTDLIPLLQETFANEVASGRLTLLQGDVLDFDTTDYTLHATRYKVIANIPYYITGAIISRFLSAPHQPSCMVVLIQKEVAERAVAHDKKESLLSLSIKVYGTPKVFYRVSRGSFFPSPKVDSAILQISNISRNAFKNQYHEDMFFKVIHAGFAHKRKLLLSNLRHAFPHLDITHHFESLNLSPKIRAEDVTLSIWLQLSLNISTQS